MLDTLRRLYQYRGLVVEMTRSQIAYRYKQSILGGIWAIIQPLSMMIVFTVFFGKFLGIQSEGVPYPIFSYCALLPWMLFASSLQWGIPSLVTFANLVRKIYFPREIFPLSMMITSLFDFVLATGVYVCLMFYYHWLPGWTVLYTIPVLLLQLTYTFGVLLFGSALCVKFRDIRFAVQFGIALWMYMSPVVFSLSAVPQKYLYAYVAINPMAGFLDSYRRAVVHGQAPEWAILSLAAGVSVVVCAAGFVYFRRKEMEFADIV